MNIRTRDEVRWHTREMLIDDQVVCWLTVIDYQMRIGSTSVRMAGIAGVETKYEHRKKGYMRVLFDDTLKYMTAGGYDVSLLFGIPDFYDKFGYAPCLADCKTALQTRDAERAAATAPACQIRPFESADLPDILALYERANASRTGSLVRTAEHFKGFQKGTWWDQPAEAVTLLDAQGRFAGYAAWDKRADAVNVIEAESLDATLHPALLAEFARQAIAKRCGQITLHMPYDHPFVEFSRRYGCESTLKVWRNAAGMGRIMNLAGLFEKLKPELEARLARKMSQPVALKICGDLGETLVQLGGGAGVPTIMLDVPQYRLLQLLMGYRSVQDVLNDTSAHASEGAEPLLDAIFPRGFPYVWTTDEF
jgi:predicted acetyltransferase